MQERVLTSSIIYMRALLTSIILFITSSIALSQVEVKTTKETKLLDCQGIEFAHFDLVPTGAAVKLTDYYAGYFTATYNGKHGYIYYPFLNEITGLDELKKQGDERNKGLIIESCLLQQYKKKYGDKDGTLAYTGKPWIGMKSEIATDILGKPSSVNSTEFEGTKAEQWVYESSYLYFDNGILKAIQKTR